MDKKIKEQLISELLKSENIKEIYDDYIVKEIPFEKWVRNTTNHLLKKID